MHTHVAAVTVLTMLGGCLAAPGAGRAAPAVRYARNVLRVETGRSSGFVWTMITRDRGSALDPRGG